MAHLERRVVEVLTASPLVPRGERLVSLAVPAHRMTAGPERKPVQIDPIRRGVAVMTLAGFFVLPAGWPRGRPRGAGRAAHHAAACRPLRPGNRAWLVRAVAALSARCLMPSSILRIIAKSPNSARTIVVAVAGVAR